MASRFFHRLPFGAEIVDAHSTMFRLWAPAREQVSLEVHGLGLIRMRRDDSGIFSAEAACGAGARYRYRLDAELAVADPASRGQTTDVHGYSVVVDPRAYEWQNADWQGRPWQQMVIDEVHVGSYGGSFLGVAEQLQQLAALGITAIELMPIADFPGRRNWGYDGVLPYAPASSYGNPIELKILIDTAHGLGLCVYLDVVYNHFGPDGNYLSAYAPQFFDEQRPSPWGASINFSVPQVREFFINNALYWLMEYRFDGLRLDAVHAITDPGFIDELGQRVRTHIEPHRHVHLMLENEDNTARYLGGSFDAQWNDDAHNAVHVLLTGEHSGYYANYAHEPAGHLARCLAEGFAYQGDPSPSHGGRARGTSSAHLPPSSFIFFLQNHDQIGNRAFGERLTTLADQKALEAAIALQLLSPQIPLLFMGEEYGSSAPFLYFTDFHGELATAVRDGRRREFSAFEAFADEATRKTIPDPNAIATFMQSCLAPVPVYFDEQHERRRRYYRHLLKLRREEIIPHLAGTRSLGAVAVGTHAVLAAWRMQDGRELRIAANLGPANVDIPPQCGRILFTTSPASGDAVCAGSLPGCSTSVLMALT